MLCKKGIQTVPWGGIQKIMWLTILNLLMQQLLLGAERGRGIEGER